MKRLHVWAFVLLIVSAAGCGQTGQMSSPQAEQPGGQWHASPTGTPEGDGSMAKPWDLKTVFAHPAAVKPGDTIWLHGGTYKIQGLTTSKLTGEEGKPIKLRQAIGERATLDTGDTSANRVRIIGAYTWYWGFEVMSSATTTRVAAHTSEAARGMGVDVSASGDPNTPDNKGIKFINMTVHDGQGGFGFWSHAYEGEIYGCVIYYVGCNQFQHGIYAQNNEGVKRIVDNVISDNSGWGIHAYGSSKAYLNNFHIEGNILWNNGIIFKGYTRNIHVGGGRVAENPVVVKNFSYLDPALDEGGTPAEIGYGVGARNAVVKDNYFSSPKGTALVLKSEGATLTGNTFYGPVTGADAATYPQNEFLTERPKGLHVMVRPNAYEKGRANIGVFNWDNLATVKVDVSAVLKKGDAYIVKDAQNFFGPAVAKGTYKGGAIELPMDLKETAPVTGGPMIGNDKEQFPLKQPVHTPREFGAFVLMKQP